MKRTKLLKISIAELLVACLVILLPFDNSTELMFGVQTTKSFGFFYCLMMLDKQSNEISQCPKAVEWANELQYKDGKIGLQPLRS